MDKSTPQEQQLLRTIGFSEKEANIYDMLLSRGLVTAQKLAADSGYKRATVYSVLDELVAKGVVEKDEKKPVARFRAMHPYNLKNFLDGKVGEIRTAEQKLEVVLPDLIKHYHASQHRPGVRFYEGEKQVAQLHLDMLTKDEELLVFAHIIHPSNDLLKSEDFWNNFHQKRGKKKVSMRVITTDTPEGKEFKEGFERERKNVEARAISAEKYPLTIDKKITGNKVALIAMSEKEMIGVLIESEDAARNERSLFELAWDAAKK